eukprot:5805259-Ditylum_brightwellii.AAC.1
MAIDTESGFQINVQIEWVMADRCTWFNLCAALVIVLEKMQGVNPSLYMESKISNTMWKKPTNIPTGNNFSTAFDTKQEPTF